MFSTEMTRVRKQRLQYDIWFRYHSHLCCFCAGYMQEGFLPLQFNIDHSIMHHLSQDLTNQTAAPIVRTELRRSPYPPYNNDLFVLVLQNQFPFIIMVSFVFVALQIVKDVVHEKERKLKVIIHRQKAHSNSRPRGSSSWSSGWKLASNGQWF